MDNTWATPLYFQAVSHGIDLSILACTKYIAGHSDLMLGSVTAAPALWPALRKTVYAFGQEASPDDCYHACRRLRDRKRVGTGRSVSVRVDRGGWRIIKKK